MKPLSQINVIPFIDIMLVLLAVVLTTATFVAQGKIPVTLPTASQGKPIPRMEHVRITIDASGTVYLDEKALSLEALDAQTAELIQRPGGNTRFLLHVDENTAFRHFVGVVDILKGYEIADISIVTERR